MDDELETIEPDCEPMTVEQLAAWMKANTRPAPPDVELSIDPDDYPLF